MIIDFRLRPPFEDYTTLGMYKNKARCESYAANIGCKLAPSIAEESMANVPLPCMERPERSRAARWRSGTVISTPRL